jgi:hypothetical protein
MLRFQIHLQWLLWMPEADLSEFSCRNLYIFCCYYPFAVEAAAAAVAVKKMILTPPWYGRNKMQVPIKFTFTCCQEIVSRSNDIRFFGNDDHATTVDDMTRGEERLEKARKKKKKEHISYCSTTSHKHSHSLHVYLQEYITYIPVA